MRIIKRLLLESRMIWLVLLILTGCATAGRAFVFESPSSIQIGKTTQAEVLTKYGEPFRAGYANGNLKWTYGYYRYRLFGDTDTKDLDITFDKNGTVSEYTFATSIPEEKKLLTGGSEILKPN
jgi:hypothetical protein